MGSSENTGNGPVRDGGYSVDLEHLDAVVAKIGGLVGFITASLEGLDQRLAAAHQSWTGQAADSHIAAHVKWAASAQEAREGIDIMRAAAASAQPVQRRPRHEPAHAEAVIGDHLGDRAERLLRRRNGSA